LKGSLTRGGHQMCLLCNCWLLAWRLAEGWRTGGSRAYARLISSHYPQVEYHLTLYLYQLTQFLIPDTSILLCLCDRCRCSSLSSRPPHGARARRSSQRSLGGPLTHSSEAPVRPSLLKVYSFGNHSLVIGTAGLPPLNDIAVRLSSL
jgi:hypothetical protein